MSRPIGLTALSSPPLITPACRLSLGADLQRNGAGAAASGTSPWSDAANKLLAFPFVLEVPTKFYKGFWLNGSAASGSVEVALYDASYNKIITTGAVGAPTVSVPQVGAFVFGPWVLTPGLYYGAMAHNSTTTNHHVRWAATQTSFWQALGCWQQTAVTLDALPATATPGDMTVATFPVFGFITRSAFDL